MMLRIAIGYENFGPYHLARLKALATKCELLALEFVKQSATYNWESTGQFAFNGLTLETEVNNSNFSETVYKLEKALTAFSPDVVFVPGWSASQALAMLHWSRKAGVPSVVMSDSQEIDEPRTLAKEFVKSRLLSLFDGALVAGIRHRKYLQKLGFKNQVIRTPYDVVDNAHFAPRADTIEAPYRRNILCCARLVEKKNLSTLLVAYRRFLDRLESDEQSAPNLIILGEGPLRAALTGQIADLELDHKVTLPGFVGYQMLPAAYHSARIFVLASTTEQWGLVVNEAMAAGCPVVVSDRAGCGPELVQNGRNGFSFNPGDPNQLANRLLMLHTNSQALAKYGSESQRIVAKYGVPEHVSAVLALAADVKVSPRRQRFWLGNLFLWVLLEKARRGEVVR